MGAGLASIISAAMPERLLAREAPDSRPSWLGQAEIGEAGSPPAHKPNIVLILADDLSYGDLSSYGAKDIKTPNIDKLVASGMRFDNFYANCPVCSPTRASLLTGRYPDLVGVPGVIRTHLSNNWGYLAPQAVPLPKLLKQAGCHTAIIGKWHLGLTSPNKPNERGFDHFHGFLGDMMDDYYDHRRHGINWWHGHLGRVFPRLPEGRPSRAGSPCYVSHRANPRQGPGKGETQPFFLYLAYNAPHTPIQPPKDWLQRVKNREKAISDNCTKLIALIEHLDEGIGRVLAALKNSGVSENTLVIFTSDNGGQLRVGACNGPLRGGKQDMYEGGIRVPMCAVWPGKITPGSRSNRIALTMDLFPTICQAAGARIDYEIDGRSILPTLLGSRLAGALGKPQPAEDRVLFWVRREGGGYGGRAYKLLQNSPFESLQLYNLKDDPQEQHPLDKKHRMYQKLFTALRNHIIEAGAVPWQRDPARRERDPARREPKYPVELNDF